MSVRTITEWKNTDKEIYEKILNKHRDINTDYDGWFDGVFDTFVDDMKKIGFYIEDDEISFSGFWSQGDGASFTGYIEVLEYLKSTKQLTKYSALVRAIRDGKIEDSVSISRTNSNYCHENTTYVDDIEYYEDLTPLQEEQLSELEEELEEVRLEKSSELYKKLNDDYDYLSSDEVVAETLQCNEYEFDEDGDIV